MLSALLSDLAVVRAFRAGALQRALHVPADLSPGASGGGGKGGGARGFLRLSEDYYRAVGAAPARGPWGGPATPLWGVRGAVAGRPLAHSGGSP